jgi:AsmA-like C-terminal region/Protein of unknown function
MGWHRPLQPNWTDRPQIDTGRFKRMSKLRLAFKIVVMLLLMLVGVAVLYLATFDLNNYRQQLAESLGEAIGEPVSIGQVQFTLQAGPSIDCRNLVIGVADPAHLQIETEHLFLKLQLLPLFSQRLEFTEIILQHPVIRLPSSRPERSGPESASDNARLEKWLLNTQVQKLRLTDAEFLLPQTADQPPATLVLQLYLDNFRPQQSGHLLLAGRLERDQETSSFNLEGLVRFQDQLTDWRSWDLQASGTLGNLRPANWLAMFNVQPPALIIDRIGQAQFSLLGQPSKGLNIELTAPGDALAISGRDFQHFTLPPLKLTALFTDTVHHEQLDRIELSLGRILITGGANLDRAGPEGSLNLQLKLVSPLTDLSLLLPLSAANKTGELLQKTLLAGQLELDSSLDMPLADLPEPQKWLSRLQLTATLRDTSIATGVFGQATDLTLKLQQQNGHLQIISGHANWLDTRFEISGEAVLPTGDELGSLNLSVQGEPVAGRLTQLLPENLKAKVVLAGKIPTRLTLSGPFDNLKLGYLSDVKFLQGQLGNLYFKPAGLEGKLHAEGALKDGLLQIPKAGVTLPPFDLSANGTLNPAAGNGFHAELKLAAIDLQRAQFRSPLLKHLNTRGQLTAQGTLDSSKAGPLRFNGRISFQEFGLQITRVLADLQQINGNLQFSEKGLDTAVLNAHLGESPVTLQGGIDRWDKPEIRLHLQGKTVRAEDLIFPSEQALLRDLNGQLRINSEGIDFESVTVRLDGGTVAHIQGRLESYRAPHVALEITSAYGNIDEVIDLWHTDHPRPRPLPAPGHQPTTTEIRIHADQGQIGPFRFSDADALLKTDGRGHLVILPLHFHHQQGYGVGQVVLDSSDPDLAPLLTVSGHVENFDSLSIYRDLLQRDGLVSGLTRGDFNLQGEPGKNFLATSSGGVSLQIDNGTLHRLPLISKVFSLLNVSQLLTLNAPEMSDEGMPFREITGSFVLRKGVLSTDNLLIHSNSMDMSLIIDQDLKNRTLNGMLGVKPLKVVDKIVTNIPLVGWILAGEDKAVLTALFSVRGSADDPEVLPAPATSIAKPIMGIFVRTLQLPGKMVTDITDALQAKPKTESDTQTSPADAPQSPPR